MAEHDGTVLTSQPCSRIRAAVIHHDDQVDSGDPTRRSDRRHDPGGLVLGGDDDRYRRGCRRGIHATGLSAA
jgi:hypothetical protein